MTEQRGSAPRSVVELDPATGTVRMGEAEKRVRDLSDPEQLYPAYLSLLYAVRGARRGEEIPLRSADLEALLQVIGDDPEYIERKLVELMGCSQEEASLLKRVLLRHRALTAGVGVAAGLSLVALLGPGSAGATPAPAPVASIAPVAGIGPADPTELPPLPSYATTDSGAHVPVPQDWAAEPELAPATVAPPAPVAPAEVAPAAVSPAKAVPSAVPSAAPAGETVPAAETAPVAETAPSVASAPAGDPDEVRLGEPRAPIDRAPAGDPDEVRLGEPRAPIDRAPAGDPDEVRLGEPRAPIDRPATDPTTDPATG